MPFEITNRSKFNNDHLNFNDNFKNYITLNRIIVFLVSLLNGFFFFFDKYISKCVSTEQNQNIRSQHQNISSKNLRGNSQHQNATTYKCYTTEAPQNIGSTSKYQKQFSSQLIR